jgi:hypothetical protein
MITGLQSNAFHPSSKSRSSPSEGAHILLDYETPTSFEGASNHTVQDEGLVCDVSFLRVSGRGVSSQCHEVFGRARGDGSKALCVRNDQRRTLPIIR